MATDLEPAVEIEVAVPPPPEECDADWPLEVDGCVLLRGVPWKLYRRLRKVPENRNVRMTYDQGDLEIMSPSRDHEVIAALLETLVEVWTLERNIEILPCRAMTIRRADLKRGLEPDNCFYVQNELQMRNNRKPNFKVDPPPDLAIEVETSRKLLDKVSLYASFGVPELWRWSKNSLTVFECSGDKAYTPRTASICIPDFPLAKVEEVVRRQGTMGYNALVRSFRDWVRTQAPPATS